MFMKLDIQDGFWRLYVDPTDTCNFVFILPDLPESLNKDPTIVVCRLIPMGWTLILAYFCTTLETAFNIANILLHCLLGLLPFHPLKTQMLGPINPDLLNTIASLLANWTLDTI